MKITNIRPFIFSFLTTICCQLLLNSLFFFGFSPEKMMRTLPNMSMQFASFTSPLPNKTDIFEQILPKLHLINNSFQLKKESSLIKKAHASFSMPEVIAYSVVDLQTGDILMEKNGDTSLPIASLTKIMSSIVALDLAHPEDRFSVSRKATLVEPTAIGVKEGEQLSVEELLHAMLLTSANDATQTMADGIDTKYGQAIFVRSMNEKAHFLQLTHTHFTNPQGFDSQDHYSSANDLAVLTHYALTEYPQIKQIVGKDYAFISPTSTHRQFDLYNWNGLLDVYPGAYGVKIGNTDNAGTTTIVAAHRDGHDIAVVILGTKTIQDRDIAAATLLDEGFYQQYGLDKVHVTKEQLNQKYKTWKFWN